LREISDRYNLELDPLYAAARLWVDDIIDPLQIRAIISSCIGIASNNPHIPKFNPGVIQV
jgi:Acetyl-CoA carboxylase, carboxyltransferase component (subunits alpha and beta)